MQDCPPLEILLSDDCSSDDTYARLRDAAAGYSGPHHVMVRRNPFNMGIGAHYNALLEASSGELLVTAAGDDVSTPDRVSRLVAAWNANGRRADLLCSHVNDIDLQGQRHGLIRVDDLGTYAGVNDWLRRRPYIIGAGHAFTRRMMTRFGPLRPGIIYEDQVMVFRAILGGGAITVDAPLVDYRRGGSSAPPQAHDHDDLKKLDDWNERQLEPILAEMRQMVDDARIAGCEPLVESHLRVPIQDRLFALGLLRSHNVSDRWHALRTAPQLPIGWRLRKVLQRTFPRTTSRVKALIRLRKQLGSRTARRCR